MNRLKNVHPIPVLPYPVTKTGTYFNQAASKYEIYFVLNGKVAKFGECQRSEGKAGIVMWRATSMESLRRRIAQHIDAGNLIVNPLFNVPGIGRLPSDQ